MRIPWELVLAFAIGMGLMAVGFLGLPGAVLVILLNILL